VAGSGLAVYEIVRALRDLDNNLERLRAAYHFLSDQQLRSALAYADAYPVEIEQRLHDDAEWTPERVWETYPFMRPAAKR
jgi:uncharacterized protein (DUF433 family)